MRLIEAIDDLSAELERQRRAQERRRKAAALLMLLLLMRSKGAATATLADKAGMAGLVAMLRRRGLLKPIEVAAFTIVTATGRLVNPSPIYPGDTMYIQPTYGPRAGTISRDATGSPYAVALAGLAAGHTGLIKAELLQKRWIHGAVCKTGPCEICSMNAAAGWLPADTWFASGVEEPAQHPHCDCFTERRRWTPV